MRFTDLFVKRPVLAIVVNLVILIAGLQSIRGEYYEAATLEGAGFVRRLVHITWPLLLPYTYTAVLLTTIGTLRIFDLMWIMTQGGPSHATETVATYLFTTAFTFQRAGYAQSLGFILLALGILYLLAVSAIGAALQGIFVSALYEYAAHGQVPEGFDARTMKRAFQPK